MTRKGLDVSHTDASYRDVSGLSPQHDKRGHDGTSHSEGVLQSKTTEESNKNTSQDVSNRDISHSLHT